MKTTVPFRGGLGDQLRPPRRGKILTRPGGLGASGSAEGGGRDRGVGVRGVLSGAVFPDYGAGDLRWDYGIGPSDSGLSRWRREVVRV